MKFKDEYWVLTEDDVHNYAIYLKTESECENALNPKKPVYDYDHCRKHALKQYERNIKLSERDLKIATLKAMIEYQKERFYSNEHIKASFGTLKLWFDHLGKIGLNKIFLIENQKLINKLI